MTTDGALLGTAGGLEHLDNKLVAAIVTNAWNDYDHAGRVLFPSKLIRFQALELNVRLTRGTSGAKDKGA